MTVRYFSGFSGIGGFEVGIRDALPGAKCIGYSEIDKHAIETYERHFDHDNFGDATQIDPKRIPDFDLYVGGFPCQPFSSAGAGAGFGDTRGTLFFDIARILSEKRPRNFILENVKGLLSHDGGRTFRTIVSTLASLGYCVEWRVCNTKDFGPPQHRERVFIVGHFGAVPERPVFTPQGSSNPNTTIGVTTKTAVARTLTGGGNSGGNHSGMTVIRQGATDRRLTPVECERLHGFPDGWTDSVSRTQRYKQLGNTVSPPVIEHIISRIYGA